MIHQKSIIDIYNKHAADYDHKFRHFDLYNDTFNDFLNLISPTASLLELGCGPGNVIKYMQENSPHLQITGIDLAENMIALARKYCPRASYKVMNVLDINSLDGKFDAIVAAFCLPYIAPENLDTFFNNLETKTESKGLIYLSCMEGETEKSGFEKTSFTGDSDLYIYYHQRAILESKMKQCGFNIIKSYTKDYPETDGTTTTDLIYIGRKQD